MKKLIFIFLLFASVSTLFAQDYSLMKKDWFKAVSDPLGSDTLAGTTAQNVSIFVGKDEGTLYLYDHYIDLDSLGDGTNVAVTLQGSYNNSTWINIGSAQTWAVTTSDTTLRFTNLTAIQTSTEVTASAIDYSSGLMDSTAGAGNYLVDDTITIAQRTTTITVVEGAVGYPYVRIYLLGAGASAGCDIDAIRWAFLKPKDY